MSRPALPWPVLLLLVTRGLSSIGGTLVAFALDIWVFRETGSYRAFVLLAVLANLPIVLFAPFAGWLTDRFSKRLMLMLADAIALASVLAALLLHALGALGLATAGAIVLLLAIAGELRWSSLSVLVASLVERDQLERANAIQQSFRGLNVMLGPVLGAVGIELLGMNALLVAGSAGYLLSGLSLAALPIAHDRGQRGVSSDPLWRSLTLGFRWVWERPPLRRLLGFFMLVNVGVSVFTVTFPPYLLSFASSQMLGLALGALGAGAFGCGLTMGRKRRSPATSEVRILWGTLGFGVCVAAWGLCRHPAVLLMLAAAIGVLETVILASSQTIWQAQVPKAIQGRIFAVRTVTAYALIPVALIGSVPLAHSLLAPLLAEPGLPLAALWGGSARTASIGLLTSLVGALIALLSAFWLAAGGLRLRMSEAPPQAPAATANS